MTHPEKTQFVGIPHLKWVCSKKPYFYYSYLFNKYLLNLNIFTKFP